jgi:hypothetical protein
MIMFAASLASRGVGNTKTDIPTKQLRVLSCFGGGPIQSKCPFLKVSSVDKTKHFCDKCGCGDKKHTWLIKESNEYSKLDYPILNCPMKMPGFSNYDPNFTTQDIKMRKEAIESLPPEQLQYIQVTIGSNSQKEKLINDVNKIVGNS